MSGTQESNAEQKSVSVRYWGVRGSIPTPGPHTVRYGGNTSCVELRAGGRIIILDAGTGIHPLGEFLVAEAAGRPMELTVLVTHTHWDHIQGFPFFAPAYGRQNKIRVLGFSAPAHGFAEAFTGQMAAPYFPLTLSQMQAGLSIGELSGEGFEIGGVRVTACRTNHTGLCHAYRLDTDAGSICYVPDHEAGGADEGLENEALAKLIRSADLVILDSQYTADEYREHRGWGHSATDAAVRLARDAQAKELHLFHHDPAHDDDFLDRMLEGARRIADGSGMRVESAREGGCVTLPKKG